MSETFFITGATGFIGGLLAERLTETGKRVRCLARSTSNRKRLEALGVEFVDGDLNDREALRRGVEGADVVFHLAGMVFELRRGGFDAVNRGGTRNVAEICAEVGKASGKAPTLVAVSSLAAAGPAPKSASKRGGSQRGGLKNGGSKNDGSRTGDDASAERLFDGRRLKRETDAPNPISAYGRSKLAGERELLRFADATPTTIVRPPYVFGGGDSASIPLYKMAKNRGAFVIPGFFDRFYSFVEVGDLTTLLIAAAERGERAEPTSLDPIETAEKGSEKGGEARCSGRGIYFPTSANPIRFSEYGAALGRAFGRKTRTFKIPPMGVLGAGVYGEIVKAVTKGKPIFDWNKATEALGGPWICSGEKAERDLGLRFETPLAEQFAATAERYLSQGWI